jgi:hypothetical protein
MIERICSIKKRLSGDDPRGTGHFVTVKCARQIKFGVFFTVDHRAVKYYSEVKENKARIQHVALNPISTGQGQS